MNQQKSTCQQEIPAVVAPSCRAWPLQRRRLVVVRRGRHDGRSRELYLTKAGLARLDAASKGWAKAQAQFEGTLGGDRASELRGLLRAIVDSDFRADATQ